MDPFGGEVENRVYAVYSEAAYLHTIGVYFHSNFGRNCVHCVVYCVLCGKIEV